MLQLACFLVAIAFSGGTARFDASHPDFSGSWILEKSDPAGATPTEVVRQNGNTLAVGEGTHGMAYRLDGVEARSTSFGAEVVSLTHWEGDELIILRTDSYPTGLTRRTKQVWKMSGANRTVTYFDVSGTTPQQTSLRIYRKAG